MRKASGILSNPKDVTETIVFQIAAFVKNWIFPAYHLRNLLIHRYDLVRLPGLKPQEYCDCLERMFRANMALITEFMEKEKPEEHVLWYDDGKGFSGPRYGIPKNTRLYLPEYEGHYVMDIIKEIYNWFRNEYPALLADNDALLDFWCRVHVGEFKDDGVPDENNLIPCEFDKSGCPTTLSGIKALPNVNWRAIEKYLNEDEYLDESIVRSRHTDLESRIFHEKQKYLHLCIEVRPFLWT